MNDAPNAGVEYTLADGQLLRNGQPLANYDPQTQVLDFLPNCAHYRAPVVRWLRENGLDVAPKHAEAVRRPPSEPPPVPPEAVGAIERKAATIHNVTLADCTRIPEFPDAPRLDPMLGDKTPEFVEWLRQHHPEAFNRRYATRKTHLS